MAFSSRKDKSALSFDNQFPTRKAQVKNAVGDWVYIDVPDPLLSSKYLAYQFINCLWQLSSDMSDTNNQKTVANLQQVLSRMQQNPDLKDEIIKNIAAHLDEEDLSRITFLKSKVIFKNLLTEMENAITRAQPRMQKK